MINILYQLVAFGLVLGVLFVVVVVIRDYLRIKRKVKKLETKFDNFLKHRSEG
ncbi:hypothetical protein HXA35_11630 [Bacillus sp. A301a_S52]|nr:hypothetical protein [Bacillus sp. A301a_S52]